MNSRCLSLGDVVEDVRTVFEERGDVTLYIPTFTPHSISL